MLMKHLCYRVVYYTFELHNYTEIDKKIMHCNFCYTQFS